MYPPIKTLIIIISLIKYIISIKTMCGGTKNNDPRSKYECAGLIKDSGKTHCCLFNASDSKLKCEPLNNTEYGNLEEHTTKKKMK